jgi:hypothetical protein
MNAASDYTAENVMATLCDGVPCPVPDGTWISLHTADPGKTGSNEVLIDAWPGYVRRQVTTWNKTANGERKNGHQLTYPSMGGIADVTVTHWVCWDVAAGGNPLFQAPLETPRLLKTGDVYVFDTNTITARQS